MPEEDDAIAEALARVTADQWSTLWDALDAVAAETTHATWSGGQVVDTVMVDGVEKPVTQVPYPVYSEAVERLRSLVGQLGLILVYDWMDWDGIHLLPRRHRHGRRAGDGCCSHAHRHHPLGAVRRRQHRRRPGGRHVPSRVGAAADVVGDGDVRRVWIVAVVAALVAAACGDTTDPPDHRPRSRWAASSPRSAPTACTP